MTPRTLDPQYSALGPGFALLIFKTSLLQQLDKLSKEFVWQWKAL